jgi:protein-S-isoprenylcysteine O-methyltransferase Ste14
VSMPPPLHPQLTLTVGSPLPSAWLITLPYATAMALGCLEHALESHYFPNLKLPWVSALGLAVAVAGEAIRKVGIVTAQHNFTHEIQFARRRDHRLITGGIYGWVRHPGYLGWCVWAVGTQLILCNPLCTVLFAGLVRVTDVADVYSVACCLTLYMPETRLPCAPRQKLHASMCVHTNCRCGGLCGSASQWKTTSYEASLARSTLTTAPVRQAAFLLSRDHRITI